MCWQFSLRTGLSTSASCLVFQRSKIQYNTQKCHKKVNYDQCIINTSLFFLYPKIRISTGCPKKKFVLIFLGGKCERCPHPKKIQKYPKEYLDWGDRRPDQLEPEARFPHPLHHCRALQGSTSSVNNKSEKSARIGY